MLGILADFNICMTEYLVLKIIVMGIIHGII
jgi:hypothetical protein